LVLAAFAAGAATSVITALLTFTLGFADFFNTLEFIVAVATFRAGLAACSAASIVAALLSFAARFAAFVGVDIRTCCAYVLAAVADEEAEIVTLAIVSSLERTADTFAGCASYAGPLRAG